MNIMDIKIIYLVTVKISPHKIMKISPSTKINSRKKWKNLHLQKLITSKVNSPKINLLKVINAELK